MKTYKGKYKVKFPQKYKGDHTNVTYRSLWEKLSFKWCENNPNIEWWNSEELVVPYRCATDNKVHKYFVDLMIKYKDGSTHCVEIKPEFQTQKPVNKRRKSKTKFIQESLTYAKNMSKWSAAEKYCRRRHWTFMVWTEKDLKSLGIKILT